jgi:putative protease
MKLVNDDRNCNEGSRAIELLAPAKNIDCGIAAVNHGADAVYIGASKFGARAAAANSVQDIEKLAVYAHRFRTKVYVALNTVLTDRELPEAEKLIHRIYNAGADALIVQDMGILNMDIPPILLHASTQTDNRTVEKVKFLQDAGFSRVVLARELSLNQISEISSQTNVELEAFVHGALCVSYSGQCYISEAMCGRSANRGECAQYCRLPYDLVDADGKFILKNKHLLSLKDLDLSEYLEEMMEAGVMSFKIEGRLKDVGYVKNITAFYRKKLDAILDGNPHYKSTSVGKTKLFFEPNPEKSFRRSSTDYFLHDRHKQISQPETPKSMGEPIGKILKSERNFFEVQNGDLLHNGDGLCFINKEGELVGFRINKVENNRIFQNSLKTIEMGVFLYRNQDHAFEKVLNGNTSERKVVVNIIFKENENGFSIQLIDEEGITSISEFECEKQAAQKPEAVNENIRLQLSKLGNTIYESQQINIDINEPWFIPVSRLSEWRRIAVEKLDFVREKTYKREEREINEIKEVVFPQKQLIYNGNVTNHLSESFYREHGVEKIQPGFEIKAQEGVPLMFTKHCIKFEMGCCPREGGKPAFKEPLFLTNKGQRFELRFDCKKCEMQVIKNEK